jgi:ABC-type multidrug transport system fused ATPase/permease subunit
MLWCRVCSDLVSIPSRVGLSHAAHARVTGTLWSIAPRLFSQLASHSRHSENAGANFWAGQRKQYLSEADSRSGIVVIVAAKIAIVLVLILILVLISLSLVFVVLVLILILVAISLRKNIIGGAAAGSTIQRATLVSAKARVLTEHRADAVEQKTPSNHACRRRGGRTQKRSARAETWARARCRALPWRI